MTNMMVTEGTVLMADSRFAGPKKRPEINSASVLEEAQTESRSVP